MLRVLVVALLLANALVLAWSLGVLDGALGRRPHADREPDRLARQVNPELVMLLPDPAASQGVAAAARVAAAASQGATAASQALPASQPSAGASTPVAIAELCLEAGPLPASALPGAEKALQSAGVPAGSWTTTAARSKGVFLIYMGRFEDNDALQRRLDDLKRRNIEARPVRQAELQPGLEIARFDQKDDAEAALARLVQRGLRTARVLTLTAPQPQLMLRLPKADSEQAKALATLRIAAGVKGFAACAPATAAAAASPAGAAVAVRDAASAEAPARSASPPRTRAASAGAAPVAPAAASPASAASP